MGAFGLAWFGGGATWFLSFLGFGGNFFDRRRAKNNQQLADVLDRSGIQLRANLLVIGDSIIPAVAIDTDLDQLVGPKIEIDFLEYGLSEAVFGNRYDGIQIMCLGA